MTGNPGIDLLLEAGPRLFDPDVPLQIREEITKSKALGWYHKACKLMAQHEVAEMHAEIAYVSRMNREIEKGAQAYNGLGGPPAHRIPLGVYKKMEDIYGIDCWKDKDFTEDFLKHHPGLRIKVTRGTRGQEYAGRTRTSTRE